MVSGGSPSFKAKTETSMMLPSGQSKTSLVLKRGIGQPHRSVTQLGA